MRVIYPRFMIWSRHAQHAIAVELGKMRCERIGHKKLVGVWRDREQKHIAFCVECETFLPDVEVPTQFQAHREVVP
jgi:hypothetical protein